MILQKLTPQLNLDGNVVEESPVSHPHEEVETVVGPSVHVEGDFASQGNIIVKGTVTGTVTTSQLLMVEPGGKVVAEVKAKKARIAGEVKGNIHVSESLDILAGAKIVGDIETTGITVESGALLYGKITMPHVIVEEPKPSTRHNRSKQIFLKKQPEVGSHKDMS